MNDVQWSELAGEAYMSVEYVKGLQNRRLTVADVVLREFNENKGDPIRKAVIVWTDGHPALPINATNARYLGRIFSRTSECIGAVITLGTKVFSIPDKETGRRHEQEGVVIIGAVPPEAGERSGEPEPEPEPEPTQPVVARYRRARVAPAEEAMPPDAVQQAAISRRRCNRTD